MQLRNSLIPLNARVDIFVPLWAKINVKSGEKVKANRDKIAEITHIQ
ncbi:hypothetical protein ES705_44274 [subsurface metagenome]